MKKRMSQLPPWTMEWEQSWNVEAFEARQVCPMMWHALFLTRKPREENVLSEGPLAQQILV